LKKRLPLFGYVSISDDPYLESMGDAAIGDITPTHYPINLDTPRSLAFLKAYQAKYGLPSQYSETGYVAAQMIGAAVEALKGDVENVQRVADAIRKVAPGIETPSGRLAFDQYNQRIVDVYVVRVEKREGRIENVVIDRLGKVAQADVWKWWNK